MENTIEDRIHIAVDATPIAMGGGLVVLLNYLRQWRAARPRARLTVLAWRPEVLEAVRKIEGLEVVPLGEGRGQMQAYLWRLYRLPRILNSLGPDVVLAHNALVRGCRAPQVVLYQGQWPLIRIYFWRWVRRVGVGGAVKIWARHRVTLTALRKAACNVFISRSLREQARCFEPDSLDRNFVVYNGVRRPENFEELALTQPDRPREPLLFALQHSLANMVHPYKESATLMAAFATCRRMRPDVPWHLEIVGRGGLALERQLARQWGVMDAVDFVDYYPVPELYARLQRALCLVFPSVMEGFGLPPLEAMVNGTPVVVADSSAMPEVVGEAGLVVRARDPEAFARAIILLYENPQERARYVRAGLERARRFDWATSARELFDLLVRHAGQAARKP